MTISIAESIILLRCCLLFCREILIDNETGHVKKGGDYYKLPILAKTFKTIAKEGANAFYNGSLTDQLVEDFKNLNSIITKEDLANYQ